MSAHNVPTLDETVVCSNFVGLVIVSATIHFFVMDGWVPDRVTRESAEIISLLTMIDVGVDRIRLDLGNVQRCLRRDCEIRLALLRGMPIMRRHLRH